MTSLPGSITAPLDDELLKKVAAAVTLGCRTDDARKKGLLQIFATAPFFLEKTKNDLKI